MINGLDKRFLCGIISRSKGRTLCWANRGALSPTTAEVKSDPDGYLVGNPFF